MSARPSLKFRNFGGTIHKKTYHLIGMIGMIIVIIGFVVGLGVIRQVSAATPNPEVGRQPFAEDEKLASPDGEADQIKAINAQDRWPCMGRDNGTGTVDLPVEICKYIAAPEQNMHILAGLPLGDSIDIQPTLHSYTNIVVSPGGSLGGEIYQFDAILSMDMVGTGTITGFSRSVDLDVAVEIHTAPRILGSPAQSFPVDLFSLHSSPLVGDPDFISLAVIAGTSLGLPSPGNVSMKELPDGNYQVDNFFDITYQIDFEGEVGSMLEGYDGSTIGPVRVETVSLAKCIELDVGIGTVYLPPETCGYEAGTQETMEIIDGLPPGTTIGITPTLNTITNFSVSPGGTLSGEVYAFDAILHMDMVGTDTLAGTEWEIELPVQGEIHAGPHTPGDPVQTFTSDFYLLQGNLIGDPDFASLTLTAGTGNMLPSPGSTTLTELPNGNYAVESFFDIHYQIDFVGAPGGVLEGLSGSTTGVVRWVEGRGLVPDQPTYYLPLIFRGEIVPYQTTHYLPLIFKE